MIRLTSIDHLVVKIIDIYQSMDIVVCVATNMTRPQTATETATQKTHDVFFQTADYDNGRCFIKIEESKAIEMEMTVMETTIESVIVGVTGSEYLITENRVFAFVEVTNDNRFVIA